jgi:hypothetical protein
MATRKKREAGQELTHEQFVKLVESANSGDAAALAELRRILDHNPQVWRSVADMARHGQAALIKLVAGKNRLLAESLERKSTELMRSLTAPDATLLEQLAAERVLVCWLQVQHLDMRCANLEGGSRGWASFWVRAQEQSQRNYESAVKHLLTVQRLQGRSRGRLAASAELQLLCGGTPPQNSTRRPQGRASAAGAGTKPERPARSVASPGPIRKAASSGTVPFREPGRRSAGD